VQKEVYKAQIDQAYSQIIGLNRTITNLYGQINGLNVQVSRLSSKVDCLEDNPDSLELTKC
jgi:outer membrane murein-binding lipoprotein Lpp